MSIFSDHKWTVGELEDMMSEGYEMAGTLGCLVARISLLQSAIQTVLDDDTLQVPGNKALEALRTAKERKGPVEYDNLLQRLLDERNIALAGQKTLLDEFSKNQEEISTLKVELDLLSRKS